MANENKCLLDLLEIEDLPPNFKAVGEFLDIESVKILIELFGGSTIYVPMQRSLKSTIKRFIQKNKNLDLHEIVNITGINDRSIYKIRKELKEEKQYEIFPSKKN